MKQLIVHPDLVQKPEIKALAAEHDAQVVISAAALPGSILIFDDELFFPWRSR